MTRERGAKGGERAVWVSVWWEVEDGWEWTWAVRCFARHGLNADFRSFLYYDPVRQRGSVGCVCRVRRLEPEMGRRKKVWGASGADVEAAGYIIGRYLNAREKQWMRDDRQVSAAPSKVTGGVQYRCLRGREHDGYPCAPISR